MGKKSGPTAANTVKKKLSMLFNFAIKREMGVTFSLARYADSRKENAEGYHTWTDQEIIWFKEHHPTGSKPRLAMMLFIWTGAFRQDVAAMGWRNVQGERRETGPICRSMKNLLPNRPMSRVTSFCSSRMATAWPISRRLWATGSRISARPQATRFVRHMGCESRLQP